MKNIEKEFMIYFDGIGGMIDPIGKFNTYYLGVTKLKYHEDNNTLDVWLRRPGLLIGKGGEDFDKLKKYLGCEINIIETIRLGDESVITYKGVKGRTKLYPRHEFTKYWEFNHDEEDEALLAQVMARVAKKNGITPNELCNLFPAVLRVLKSDIDWSK